jgi:hypothetical protein
MDCPFSFDDVDMEIDDAENQENSHPNTSTVDEPNCKRDRGLRGMAFRFNGKVTGFTCFCDSSQHDRIREFNTRIGKRLLATKEDHDPLNWISYVVLSYEIGQLSSSAETCDIPGNWYPEDYVHPLNLQGKFWNLKGLAYGLR